MTLNTQPEQYFLDQLGPIDQVLDKKENGIFCVEMALFMFKRAMFCTSDVIFILFHFYDFEKCLAF